MLYQLPSEFIASIRDYKQHVNLLPINICLMHLVAWLERNKYLGYNPGDTVCIKLYSYLAS